MSIFYHMNQPESSATEYLPSQTIDFALDIPGRKLLKNTIRIEGNIVARTDLTNPWLPTAAGAVTSCVDMASNVKIDNAVGFHSVFDSFTCETQSKGVLESLQNYPRFISQHARSTLGADDMLTSKYVSEGRGGCEVNGNLVLQPIVDQAWVTGEDEQVAQRTKPSFSIKPMVCFNRTAGGDYSFSRGGFIRVSCILAANNHALFGGGDAANYVLENVVCRYQTIEDDGKDDPLLMRSYVNVVSSMNSTSTNISARVPSQQVSSLSMSFAKQSSIQSSEFNSYALESLPDFDSVEYLFANSLQNFITYRITDPDDALLRGLASMESAGHSMVSAKTLKANRGTIYGLDFSEYVDLSSQQFSLNLVVNNSIVTTDPINVFMYFNSLIQL